MNFGVPTKLTFLSMLGTLKVGTKVRFLGCITDYDADSATLILTHDLPSSVTSSLPAVLAPKTNVAIVSISVPLSTLPTASLRNGEWINITGFVGSPATSTHRRLLPDGERAVAFVDSVLAWPAVGLNLVQYEMALAGRLDLEIGTPE
ncbi:hypothetical protein RUND412_009487 [Rhizina undulata]